GRDIRLSVSPLEFTSFKGADDPHWRLLVFQDAAIVDTVNLETVTIACWLFAIYACVMALVGTVTWRAGVQRRNWFWPTPGRRPAYWTATVLNVAAIAWFAAIFRIATVLDRPDVMLMATIGLAMATAVATYWIVTRARPTTDTDTFGWR